MKGGPDDHAPTHQWVVVSTTDRVLVLSAGCECGDDDCGFTLTADIHDAVNHTPKGWRVNGTFYHYDGKGTVSRAPAVQCEARNRNAGGRCQRQTARENHLCDHHQGWVAP